MDSKQDLLFLKKKPQKNFLPASRRAALPFARRAKRFLVSFFQKSTAFS